METFGHTCGAVRRPAPNSQHGCARPETCALRPTAGLLSLLVLCFLVLHFPAHAAERGQAVEAVIGSDASIPRYHALVIGINDYRHWQDLRQARQDAEKVAGILRDEYGFGDVVTLYDRDATRDSVVLTIRSLTRQLGRNDSLLVYFAGHGYFDRVSAEGYWVTAEARERIGSEPAITDWLDNSTLRKLVGAMQARHVLVVSDSCFSGSLFRGGRVDLTAKENAWYRRAIAAPSRWCISSGDLETVPDESVFARKFLQALQYPQQTVFSASDLAGWIKKEVAAFTDRQPLFGPMKDPGDSAEGEFVFLRRGSLAMARPVTPVIVPPRPPVLQRPKPGGGLGVSYTHLTLPTIYSV